MRKLKFEKDRNDSLSIEHKELHIFLKSMDLLIRSIFYNNNKSIFKILTGKPTRKKHLGGRRRGWDDSTKMDFKELCITTRNSVDSAQDRDYWRAQVNAVLNLRIP